MEYIKCKFRDITYPVGDNIIYNLPIIKDMGKKIKSVLIKEKIPFDKRINLICSGSSGAIIAAIISTILCKQYKEINIYHIKKNNEKSHSDGYKGSDFIGYNIVVDDLISTGKTMFHIFDNIYKSIIDLVCVSYIEDSHQYEIRDYFISKGVKFLLNN